MRRSAARQKIVEAAKTRLARQSALTAQLEDLDPEVAERAIAVFESPSAAAEWLVSDDVSSLGRRPAVRVARTRPGRLRVLQVLGAIEHGVYL